jgi:hypothetical protein
MVGQDSMIRRIAERARREHWPKPYLSALVYQGGAMVFSNAYLLMLVQRDQLWPVALATFCLAELLLLMLIARVELIPVPRAARFDGTHHALLGAGGKSSFLGSLVGFIGNLVVWVFISIWFGAVYAFSLFADPNLELFVSGAGPLEVLARLNALWPLLLSVVLALIAMIGNWQIWQRRGGAFVPEMAQPIMPKILTVFIAPLFATMAMFTFIDDDGEFALYAWCITFLGIKCLLEVGMIGLQLFGLFILDSLPPTQAQIAAEIGG